MWAVLAAIALTYGLVRAAAAEPDRKERWREARLDRLRAALAAGRVTLDQAEDGAVLAKRFRQPDVEMKFRAAAAALKKKRSRTCR